MQSSSDDDYLALCGDITLVAKSRSLSLLVRYLETLQQTWALARDWRTCTNISESTAVLSGKTVQPDCKPVQFFIEANTVRRNSTVSWGDPWRTDKLIGSRQPCRKKLAQTLGVLGPLLNRRSGLIIRNGVLLYKHLTHPMLDFLCPEWKYAICSHFHKR
jgi:hypothetical protein